MCGLPPLTDFVFASVRRRVRDRATFVRRRAGLGAILLGIALVAFVVRLV